MAQTHMASTAVVSEPLCSFASMTVWGSLQSKLTGGKILSLVHRWVGLACEFRMKVYSSYITASLRAGPTDSG